MLTLQTVFIDDEIMLVQGIRSLMEQHNISSFNVVGHYTTLDAFLSDHKDSCSLVISNLDIEDEDISNHVPKIKKIYPEARVIILTNYDNYKLVRDTMKSGADGYILKNSSFGELISCIEEVMNGEAHIGNGLQLTPPRKLFNAVPSVNKEEESVSIRKYEDRFQVRQKLTKRELEILKLVTQAMSNKEIAKMLFISDQTVGVHKKNIMRKLNVRSTISLIKYAIEQNLV